MTALSQDQRFALLLVLSLAGSSFLFHMAQAQALTAEDRLSVLKFVGAFMNFLDMELDNSTAATPTPTPGSVTLETTEATTSGTSTEETTEAATTSDSTTPVASSSSSTTEATEPVTTTEAVRTTARRRMCFKRFCYKFGSDKGYIV